MQSLKKIAFTRIIMPYNDIYTFMKFNICIRKISESFNIYFLNIHFVLFLSFVELKTHQSISAFIKL